MNFREYLQNHSDDFCTGCSACVSICPVGALTLQQDRVGYYISSFNPSKCINCNQCETICPIFPAHISSIPTGSQHRKWHAVQMIDEIRKISSSGGIFYAIARKFIEEKKAVVYGAKWDGTKVRHDSAETMGELTPLLGAKYVQSDLSGVFPKIKQQLKSGKTVVFCGCPCQVAGLRSFLSRDYENLYTIDLLCYYAPSIKMFQDYISENYDDRFIECKFRDKANGWTSETMTVVMEDKRTSERIQCIRDRKEDIFQKAFHSKILMSRHCINCKFNSLRRTGDITIGDFWNIGRFHRDFDDKLGTSVAIVNTRKGEQMLDGTKKFTKKITETSSRNLRGNRIGFNKAANLNQCTRFYDMYSKTGIFSKSADDTLHNKHDIALIGCWDIRNYGSQLTYYSLYRFLSGHGYSVLLIGCPGNAKHITPGKADLFQFDPYPRYDTARPFDSKAEMIEANRYAETFILGSDQVWRNNLYRYFGRFTLLDYIFSNKKKIAYGASFGKDAWEGTCEEKAFFRFMLHRFQHISIRESSGSQICKNVFDVDSHWVADPIFLAGKEALSALSSKSGLAVEKRFLFAYILDYSPEKEQYIFRLCSLFHCEPIVITDPNVPRNPAWKLKAHTDYHLEDWLWLFEHSDYIVTDSFHGMCISLVFNKQFTAIINTNRGRARFKDYSERLELSDHILYEKQLKEHDPALKIDYEKTNSLIQDFVSTSGQWLLDAILSPHDSALDDYDFSILSQYFSHCKSFRYRLTHNAAMTILKEKGVFGFMLSVFSKCIQKIKTIFRLASPC